MDHVVDFNMGGNRVAQMSECNVSHHRDCEFEDAKLVSAFDSAKSGSLHLESLHASSGIINGLALGLGAWLVVGGFVTLLVGVARAGITG